MQRKKKALSSNSNGVNGVLVKFGKFGKFPVDKNKCWTLAS